MNCKICDQNCQKWGRQKNGRQRFYCKHCKKSCQQEYKQAARTLDLVSWVPKLVCNSVGVRSISRILKIATNTAIKYIRIIAEKISKPPVPLDKASFEIDELRTYVGNKQNQYWIAYVLCSETKRVIDFIVGKRSKRTLRMVVNTAVRQCIRIVGFRKQLEINSL